MLIHVQYLCSILTFISRLNNHLNVLVHGQIQWGGGQGDNHPGKSQVAVGSLRHSGTDHPREAMGLKVCTALCELLW